MATELTSQVQGSPRPGSTGYEARDASVPWIFGVVIFLLCCSAVIQAVLVGALNHLLKEPTPTDAWRRIGPVARAATTGSFPRLQISSRVDLGQFRANEDLELTNYGWVNRKNGIVRVPIERAMDLVLQKGLPVRTNGVGGLGPSSEQLVRQRALQSHPEDQQQ